MNIELTEEQARTLLDVLHKVTHEMLPSEIQNCLAEQISVLKQLIDNCEAEQVNEKQPMYVNKSWLTEKEVEAIKKALIKFVLWGLDSMPLGRTDDNLKMLPWMIYFLFNTKFVSEENYSPQEFDFLKNLIRGGL